MMSIVKTYSELIILPTFEERFEYLSLGGVVGRETFGYERYLNQILYSSKEWERFRDKIIDRDNGCDMACEGYDIYKYATVHHINPITIDDVINRNRKVFDPENAITVSSSTHKAIHYANTNLLILENSERRPNDTCPWK